MKEVPLPGGRVTPGVTRIGDTVRRPSHANSVFVRRLLTCLNERGFGGAPRYLGVDEHGREVLTFLPGEVPLDLDPKFPDEALVAAARLIRDYHDATSGSTLAGRHEVICHNDLSPCNFVFRSRLPVGITDFDAAAPGARLRDLGYALFLWLNLGTDGADLPEQARRIRLFCDAYGIAADDRMVSAVLDAVTENVDRLRAEGRSSDADWWQTQLGWLMERQDDLARLLN